MRGDDLSALLRSPALSLEPAPDLLPQVHRGARRVRRRRRAGGVVVAVAAAGLAVLVVPRGGGEQPVDRVAAALAERFPQATTSVERLERLNGGDVVTYFESSRWCTGAARTHVNDGCRGFVGAGEVAPFALVVQPGDSTLTIDRDTLTAGVLGTGVERVEVTLADGTVLPASAVSGDGFPRPVWWVAVPRGGVVDRYTAYGEDGAVLDVLEVRYDASYEPQASPRSSSE